MRLSKFFLHTLKEIPADATIASHQLMLRAGMIRPVMSGIYSRGPLCVRVMQKVTRIIRDCMNETGALEILPACMQPASLWETSGRYHEVSDLMEQALVAENRTGRKLVFSPTAEEVVCDFVKQDLFSYRQLPLNLYQIGLKYRDELRPKNGFMRACEFFMKDSYSFAANKEVALQQYEQMLRAYLKIFRAMDLTVVPVVANTGAIGGSYSHEMHVLSETGESKIYFDEELLKNLDSNTSLASLEGFYSMEEEKHDEEIASKFNVRASKSIEVGHLFYLGQKYTKAMGVRFQGPNGELHYPEMGCYGIGVSRLIATVIETHHDEHGIIWPKSIAPFTCVIMNFGLDQNNCVEASEKLFNQLAAHNIDVLYDDIDDSIGPRFAKMDLIGIPLQLRIFPKKILNNIVEVKNRATGEIFDVGIEEVLKICI